MYFYLQRKKQKMSVTVAAVKPAAVKKARVTPTGPVVKPHMLTDALKKLNERSGSSRQAIVKYISANFSIDALIVNKRIKKFIALGLKDGTIKQSQGTGCNGSFKIGEAHITKEKEQLKKAKLAAKKVVKASKVPSILKPKKVKTTKTDASKPKKNVKKVVKPQIPKTFSTVKPTVVAPVVAAPVAAPKTIIKPTVKKVKAVKKTIVAAKSAVAKKTTIKKVKTTVAKKAGAMK